MKDITVKVGVEVADQIVVSYLEEALDYFEHCLEKYEENTGEFIAVFATKKEEDIKLLQKNADAAKLMLNWFSANRIV